MKRGFTLLEVNLAIFIMATGILGMCGLYAFGFRESRQSVEDVAAVGFADAYLAPLVQGLSATNMTWTSWCQLGKKTTGDQSAIASAVWPDKGWIDYVEETDGGTSYRVRANPNGKADGVFNDIMVKVPSPYKGQRPSLDAKFSYGLVLTRMGAKIQLAFRASRRRDMLMAQPVIVSEVHFQGDPDR